MSTLSIISIVFFSVSGLLFITFVFVFFMTDVLASIRFLRQKGNTNAETTALNQNIMVYKEKPNELTVVSNVADLPSAGIEYAQQTVDTDELDGCNTVSGFETLDWELPDGVSFVMTKNIVICHSDKEYMLRED